MAIRPNSKAAAPLERRPRKCPAADYLRSLLGNEAIDRHLAKHHPEMHRELAGICEATALVSEAAE